MIQKKQYPDFSKLPEIDSNTGYFEIDKINQMK